ncbi:hypothetical protein D3C79_687160 [compost metagenome]
MRRVQRETVQMGHRCAARHRVETEGMAMKRRLALILDAGGFLRNVRPEVGYELTKAHVPAPRRVQSLRGAMYGAAEPARVMAQSVIMPNLVTELIAQ